MEPAAPDVELVSVSAERPKYTATLLFVPGRWCSPLCWRPMMGYLAHFGWECGALSFDRLRRQGAGLEARRDTLLRQIEALAEPPIVIGHDLGAALALRIARPLPAIVALAPGAAGSQPREGLWRRLRAAAGAPQVPQFLPPPPGGLALEPKSLRDEIARLPPLGRSASATAVVTACDESVSAALAARIGADLIATDASAATMPWGPGWEKRVAALHRWLIRTLGEPLLAIRDEDEP